MREPVKAPEPPYIPGGSTPTEWQFPKSRPVPPTPASIANLHKVSESFRFTYR